MKKMNHNEETAKRLFCTTKYGTIPHVDKAYVEMTKFFIQIRK